MILQRELPKGISPGDCYRLYAQHKVQTANGGDRIQMLRLKSTTNQEPIGPCISYAPLEHQEKQKILALREDAQDFFISVTDFLRTFTHIEVVHLDADTARDEPTLNGKGASREFQDFFFSFLGLRFFHFEHLLW